ncbi:Ig-like domain-containing protein [Streptococcus sp. SS9]|uniref:SIALI-17 repeat-containing surface protein n=1 Tax=Streptococcus sp. SS9 TaxID=3018255 RepID=UPI00263C5123|nr:SIALI-17 repeat-containing surface protein [Streptococcus sp. SS9]MDN5038751.1 Ig-like domain-containing protein [Streptococcus sp. SS9]
MISQTIAKPSFTKSKAYGLCGTLALATALLIGAGQVSADEITQPVVDAQPAVSNVYTADNAGNVTVTPSETVVPTETPVATTEVATPAPATTTEVAQPVAETPATPTSVTKEGDTITVENPNVQVDFPNGTGKYNPFEVEYKDINFPDDMAINEGDKVTFNLPKEITFQTNYDFDVKNPENNVVGKASTNVATQTVTTVFNDYFKNHPLNKQMSLKLDAKWTDAVESGKPVTVNFNGTVVTANIGKEQEIGKDELVAKWGSQDKDDPTVIDWTIRVNYARRVLNYVTLIDTMSDNQKLVDDYFVMNYVDSVEPWTDKGSAMELIKSMAKSDHGFEIKMDRLDRMVYIWYKTKLVNAVKDSTNPTNKVELKAENDGATSSSRAVLVGGKGDASGENKPVWEIPHDAPKVDIPEFQGGIPGIPEVRELPEYTEPIGTVPNEAPVHDKPEFQGGIPGIPEERELPPFEGGVVPNDAPILDLPELEIPEEPTKPTPEKPSTPENAPKTSVERPNGKVAQSVAVSYNLAPVSKETPKTAVYGGTLPSTGEKEGIASALGLVVIAAGITTLGLSFKKYNGKEDK